MFNALQYTKNLEENGFNREQAEILVGMFMQMIEFNMVNKSEFEKSQSLIHHRFDAQQADFNNRFEKMEQKFDHEILIIHQKFDKLALQLTVKLGVMLALSVGLLSTVMAIKL